MKKNTQLSLMINCLLILFFGMKQIQAANFEENNLLFFAPNQPDGFVAFDNIGGTPVASGEVFLACGPNQVEDANIEYRLYYAPSNQTSDNPTQFPEYDFGTTAGDGNGVTAFGFVLGGLESGVEYNFYLYQFDSENNLFSSPAIATETTFGDSGGNDPDPNPDPDPSEIVIVQDFENVSNFTFEDFEGLAGASIEVAPSGDNGNSLKLESVSSGNPWQGAFVTQLATYLDLTSNKTIQVEVYANQAFNLLLKVEDGGPDSAASESYTTPNAWQTLTFTMDESLDNTESANGVYQKIVFFPNWGDTDSGFGTPSTFSVYIDNVAAVASPADGGGDEPVEPGDPGDIGEESVTVDASATWLGYANVFNLPSVSEGSFVFGSPWAVIDLKTDIDTQNNSLTLLPNFNTYADNPGDEFWINSTTGEGNKIFEGITFVESTELAGNILQFSGNVESFTISSEYEVTAFIRVFNADFSFNKSVVTELTQTGNFQLLYDDVDVENDVTVQYGFAVKGVNANPANESSLGNVVVGPVSLSLTGFDAVDVQVYPNPVANVLHIQTSKVVSSVELYTISGRLLTKQNNANSIDVSDLASGMYLLKVTSDGQSISQKIIKK